MAKPRLFIGSSVEGRSVAYAIQQNLRHDAEATVWDQGVFELSNTNIESLMAALDDNDFGAFVFSPDDLVHMRQSTKSVARDNVLFEFGLFIGRLGRERVFFVIPQDSDLHIPTDLLGVTPGKYESSRGDSNMQAATGAVSNDIRLQIKKLGCVPGRVSEDAGAENAADGQDDSSIWIIHYFDGKYDAAKSALQKNLESESGDDALNTQAWMKLCDIKAGRGKIDDLVDFAHEHPTSPAIYASVGNIFRFEGYISKAIDLLLDAQKKWPKNERVASSMARCRVAEADSAGAVAELLNVTPENSPSLALQLAEVYEADDKPADALKIVQRCYEKNPTHEKLRYKYARLAVSKSPEIAACLLDELTRDDHKSVEYWGYLANACFDLSLFDKALYAYRRAQELVKEDDSSQWIVSNIGNLLNNKGLHTEACAYLEKAVKYEPHSDYAHERLSSALKKKAAEEREFQKKCLEGRRQLREVKTQDAGKDLIGPEQLQGLLGALQGQVSPGAD